MAYKRRDEISEAIPSDELVEELKDKINSKSWVAPCTFNRINRMPIDSKQCFDKYSDLTDYISSTETTAFPGMFVAVINRNDPNRGAYVLMSTEEGNLIPVKLGTVSSIVIRGAAKEEGEEPEEISATVDPQTGKATIELEEIEFGDLEVDQLTIDGTDIYDLIPKMTSFRNMQEIIEEGSTLNETQRKLNSVIKALREIAENQVFIPVDTLLETEGSEESE